MYSYTNNRDRISVLAALLAVSAVIPGAQAGTTCRDINGACDTTDTPCVCVKADEFAPVEGQHFTLNWTDASNPDLELRTASTTWVVWSQVNLINLAAANLGDVTILDTGDPDDYAVKILNANVFGGAGVGAANVGSLDLSGAQGHTSITAGRISGDLAGTLLVEADSGNGGSLNLIINGDADGDITCETIAAGDTLRIDGTASGFIFIDGEIGIDGSTKGTLDIGTTTGVLCIEGPVNGDITIDTLGDADLDSCPELILDFGTGANSIITIGAFEDDSMVQLGVSVPGAKFLGKLVLTTGIPKIGVQSLGAIVQWYLVMDGTVDLNGADIAGLMNVDAGGSGDINNGGDVTGLVYLTGSVSVEAFSGTATFDELSGRITSCNEDLDGTLTVDSISTTGRILIGSAIHPRNLGGTIHVTNAGAATGAVGAGGKIIVWGNVENTGKIEVDGPMKGSVTVKGTMDGDVLIDDKLEAGTLTLVGNVGSTASVRVNNMISVSTTHSLVDVQGIFDGDMLLDSGIGADQEVLIAGKLDLHGEIDLNAGGVAGTLSFDGGSGNVIDGGAVTGSVSLGNGDAYSGTATFASVSSAGDISSTGAANLSGTLSITGDMDGISGIAIGGGLSGNGRILVGGSSSGAVTIEEGTSLTSQITFTGGLDGGSLVINNSAGNNDAAGDILLGVITAPLPLIDTDGCILVKVWDTDPPQSNAYGDLDGDLDIVGCHSADVDFDLCAMINGTVSFDQSGCSTTYNVTHSCQGTCP